MDLLRKSAEHVQTNVGRLKEIESAS
jgi:hypothetical protein